VANGLIYFGSNDNNIHALNAHTGTNIWTYQTGGDVVSSPAIADDTVFVGSHDNNLYALNATSGTLLWKYKTLEKVVSSPAVANGAVYFGSYDHLIYAIGESSPSLQTSQISFTASGLPQNTNWTITVEGQTKSSTSDTILFNLQNGTYSFSVTPPTDYVSFPSSGTITVNSANVNEQITFSSSIEGFPWSIIVSLVVVTILFLLPLVVFVFRRRKK
jgi:outer membrane protein assembly factor BamB